MKRLLVADDHPFIIAGLEAIVSDSDYEIVATAKDGEEAIQLIADTPEAEILVIDVGMPGRSGIDVLRSMRSRGDKRPVVLLTASLDDSKLLQAFDLGVDGILLKEAAQESLFECLDAVVQGRNWIQPALLDRERELRRHSHAVDPLAPLTARERFIAELVAQGLRNRQIGDELGMTEGTIKIYLHRMYDKLGVTNRTELALLVKDTRG